MPHHAERPIFLDLWRIRMPAPAWASLGHRVSGVLLVLALPGALYLLQLSLRDAQGYAQAQALLGAPWLQPLLLVLVWALLHHALAGVRFLLLDLGLGQRWPSARRSAYVVNVLGVALTLLIAVLRVA
ncbi:succinate dehydrogenase, cytochrome b556 subunit [Ectothiorhodospiraceae bacterium 2226]|nr:succinate dehydrogenase, cytochrome b556 subunit [Ectothiorhodospiraceae bacterium 2226]